MLVLTRKLKRGGDEAVITIGDSVEIKVIKIKGDQVRLGITAPTEVAVWRRELWDAKQQDATEQPDR